MHKPYVVIETHEDYLEKFRDTHCDLLYIIGDATDETVLDQTSVGARQRADCGLTADGDNLVITLLVQQKNPVSCYHIRCCRSTVGASVSLRSWYYWLLLAEDI